MESTISATTLLAFSKTPNSFISHLHRHFSKSRLNQSFPTRISSGRVRCISNGDFHTSNNFIWNSSSASSLWSLYWLAPISSRLPSVSSSAASFSPSGGGDGLNRGNRCGGSDVGQTKSESFASPDVIILDVGGMMCGGCEASVKRILESQPQVSSASANHATETVIIWPAPEAKVAQNWQEQLGETLAKHLTNCGFKSNLRVQSATEGDVPS